MRHATRVAVSVRHAGNLFGTARIEKVQDRERWFAGRVHTAKTVPEGAAGDGGDAETSRFNLAVEFIQSLFGASTLAR